MNDELALLAAILAQPEEDTPRLAFADYLDENDRPARAEFIRVQIELSQLPDAERKTQPYRAQLTRFRQLVAEHATDWAAALGVPSPRAILRRGFIEEVRFEPDEVPTGGNPALLREPLRFVRVAAARNVRTSGTPVLRKLASWPGRGRFDVLELSGLDIPTGAVEPFIAAPAVEKVRVIDAPGCFSPEGVVVLAESSHLTHLEHLNLGSLRLTVDQAFALARTRGLPRLRRLELTLRNGAASGDDDPHPLLPAYNALSARFGYGVSLSRW